MLHCARSCTPKGMQILCTVCMHAFACVRVMSAHLRACLRWYYFKPSNREATAIFGPPQHQDRWAACSHGL
jgi:hypothetical protein